MLLLYFRSFLFQSEVSILKLFPVHTDNTFSYSLQFFVCLHISQRAAVHHTPGLSTASRPSVCIDIWVYAREKYPWIHTKYKCQPSPISSQSLWFHFSYFHHNGMLELLSYKPPVFTVMTDASFKYIRLHGWHRRELMVFSKYTHMMQVRT